MINFVDSVLSVASISGIVAGPVVLLILIAAGIAYRKRQKNIKMRKENYDVTSAGSSGSSEIAIFHREATDNLNINIEHELRPQQRFTAENIEMTEFSINNNSNTNNVEPDLQQEQRLPTENIQMAEFHVYDDIQHASHD